MSALPVHVVADPKQAAAMLAPMRVRLLKELHEPASASELARRLELPRQKVNYHLRELEKAGLLTEVEQRRKGNCVERVVRATARHYLVNPDVLGELGANPENLRDRFSWAHLVAVAARAVRDLATLRKRADDAGKELATFTLLSEITFASPQALHAFSEDLSNEVARLAVEHGAEDGAASRRFTFFVGAYPTITKSEQEAEAEAQGRARRKDDRS